VSARSGSGWSMTLSMRSERLRRRSAAFFLRDEALREHPDSGQRAGTAYAKFVHRGWEGRRRADGGQTAEGGRRTRLDEVSRGVVACGRAARVLSPFQAITVTVAHQA